MPTFEPGDDEVQFVTTGPPERLRAVPTGVEGWEERMSLRARARSQPKEAPPDQRVADDEPDPLPDRLAAELPPGSADIPREWCTRCGFADPPERSHPFDPIPPCPRCGSRWRWYGRIADRDGTAIGPPLDDDVCTDCCRWEPFPGSQKHFGWRWLQTCGLMMGGCRFGHRHHADEIWIG